MKKIFLIFIILSCYKINAQNYTEVLGRPTDTSITMSIIFDKSVNVYWEFGQTSGNYTNNTPIYNTIADTPIEIIINNLIRDIN